jgi:DNA-binding beta-propeller fold protein YncE
MEELQKIYFPEEFGTDPKDTGSQALSDPDSRHYSVTLANDYFIPIRRRKNTANLPDSEVSSSQFGFPVQDERILLFADTNGYGTDSTKWDIGLSLTNEQNTPDGLRLWGLGVGLNAAYTGVESYTEYKDNATQLIISNNNTDASKYVVLTSKQLFDCDAANNIFVSFGIKMESTFIGNGLTFKAGLFNYQSGWFIQVRNDIISIVQRFTIDGIVKENTYGRTVFKDKLDGTGLSGLNIDFSLVTMFGIELGSFDGSGARFYIYARDENQNGRHRWILFADIPTSEYVQTIERNPIPLPFNFEIQTSGNTGGVLSRYGCSVVKLGADNAPLKLFSAASNTLPLIPSKEVFAFAILTKELYIDKPNNTKIFPKYLNAVSDVPIEIIFRRLKLTNSNIDSLGFKPSLREEYDPFNLVYLISGDKLYFVSIANQAAVKAINVSLNNIWFNASQDLIFGTQTNKSDILIINGSTGVIVGSIVTNKINCHDVVISGNNLYISHPGNNEVTVWNIGNITAITSVTSLTVGTNPMDLVVGDGRVFCANRNSNTISIISATTNEILQTLSVNGPNAMIHNRTSLYVASSDNKVYRYVQTGENYTLNSNFDTMANPDALAFVDTAEIIYVGSSTSKTLNIRDLNAATPTTQTETLPATTTALINDTDGNVYLYDSAGNVTDLFYDKIFVTLSSPTSSLKGNLLSSAITAVILPGLQPLGDIICSFVTSKSKQIYLQQFFQEYREFFSSSYDLNGSTIAQDLILIFLKHIGENLSLLSEQIIWLEGVGLTPTYGSEILHFSNPGSATVSLVIGQN